MKIARDKRAVAIAGFVGLLLLALLVVGNQQVHAVSASGATSLALTERIEDGVRIFPNIVYSTQDPKYNVMDVYASDDQKVHPILVFVHGGGWYGGDKSRSEKTGRGFARSKIVVAVINYRLAPKWVHPAAVQDLAAAISWLRDHAQQFNGDPDKIFVAGHSTGTHSAALVATDAKYLAAAGVPMSALRGAIMLDGRCYLLSPESMSERAKRTAAAVFGKDQNGWLDASPMRHLARDTGSPPFLIVYARGANAENEAAKKMTAEQFAGSLRQAGVRADVVRTNQTHGQIETWLGSPGDGLTHDIVEFIRKHQAH